MADSVVGEARSFSYAATYPRLVPRAVYSNRSSFQSAKRPEMSGSQLPAEFPQRLQIHDLK